MLETMLSPFSYDFFNNALIIIALVGAMCGLLSCFLILKGWSLLGDALSHAVIPGVVIAYLTFIPFSVGIFVSAALAILAIFTTKQKIKTSESTVMALVTTCFMGIGLLIYSMYPGGIRLNEVIFGRVIALSKLDIINILSVLLVVIVGIILTWKSILFFIFDPIQSSLSGLNNKLILGILFVLICLTIVSSIRAVGSILVISMLITPGAAAYLLTDKFKVMLWISGIMGALTGIVGLYVSYLTDTTPGAMVVVIQFILFFVIFTFAPKYGILQLRRLRKQNHEFNLKKSDEVAN